MYPKTSAQNPQNPKAQGPAYPKASSPCARQLEDALKRSSQEVARCGEGSAASGSIHELVYCRNGIVVCLCAYVLWMHACMLHDMHAYIHTLRLIHIHEYTRYLLLSFIQTLLTIAEPSCKPFQKPCLFSSNPFPSPPMLELPPRSVRYPPQTLNLSKPLTQHTKSNKPKP